MNPDRPGNAAISLWEATSAEPLTDRDPLAPGDVDLAIVGGGFTGLSTALHAAERGLSVQLCEAETFGHGGSGRNVGLVNAGVWLPPSQVTATLGDKTAGHFLRIFGDGPRRVFDLIERHQIRCEATREGTIHAAHNAKGFAELQVRHRDWSPLGAPVELLSASEIAARTGSPAFAGGLLDHRAGTINPMGYTRGLARAARAAGARLATGCRVTKLTREGGRWHLETSKGTVTARSLVLGTNAYTDTLWPSLSRLYHRIRYFNVATEQLENRLTNILPGRQGLWTTAPIMTSIRRDAHDRLIVGSMGRDLGGVTRKWAKRELRRLFPDLGSVAFETSWHGDIAMTPDHLPRVVHLGENAYTPIGYNGRGIITGTIFGAAMADLLSGGDPADMPLPLTELGAPERFAGVKEMAYDTAFAAHQFARGLL